MIQLSENAARKLKNIFEEKKLSSVSAVRFAVKGGGCSGFEMDVKLESPGRYDMARKSDVKFISNEIRILVDKKSLLFLDGMIVDYQESKFGHKFSYNNPNATGWCGCGESFSI